MILLVAIGVLTLVAAWDAVRQVHQLRQAICRIREETWDRRLRRAGVAVPDKQAQAREQVARRPWRRAGVPDSGVLTLMAVEVSSRLQAGADLARSWEQTWNHLGRGEFLGVDATGSPLNLVGLPKGRIGVHKEESFSAAESLVTASRFSFLSGAPLAAVLEQVAQSITQAEQARQAQEHAFTGPQLSSRVLTALPLVGVIGGQLLGAGSISWLLSPGLGPLCAVGGVSLLAAGHGVSRRLIRGARERSADQMRSTILCDLARSGLAAGASIPAVLTALGGAESQGMSSTAEIPALEQVARELLLGAPWKEAWEVAPAHVKILREGLRPGWEDGVSPLLLLEHSSRQTRRNHVAKAEEEASRLSVKLVLPLGLFLLPAFVCLGIIPVLVNLLSAQLGLP